MSAVDKLKKAADEAYKLHPKSCSHAVWHVIKEYIPDQTYHVANGLLIQLDCDPRWKKVSVGELEKLANEGILVVGGLPADKHGHVIVVYPGNAKAPGGYMYTSKKTGKTTMLLKSGSYPLAMSTSIGSWPGAMSKGDKTIWDPWGDDDKFKLLKFYRLDLSVKDKTSTCKK
jgi:hypothetical protein